jgi:alkylated DNA repair dioxygenase AlkB
MDKLRQAELFDTPEDLPHGLIYQPEFITRGEEETLLDAIAPLPLREARFQEYFARRRVVHFRSAASGEAYDESDDDTLSTGPLPQPFVELQQKVAKWLAIDPAALIHALVSEYRAGTPIGWHRDKPVYGMVVGLSLAGRGRMRFSSPRPARAAQCDGAARARASFDLCNARPDTLAMAAQHAANQGTTLLDYLSHSG